MGKRFITWFKDTSIKTKLYFVVGIMALLIAIELLTLLFAVNTLSSVRAYVGGEGLWSKAQKDAVYYLQKYGNTQNEEDYQRSLEFMKVPVGDHKTRMELAKQYPDFKIAYEGFLQGDNHPDDINGMIKLFRRFHSIYYIEKSIALWGQADSAFALIMPIGERLHNEIKSQKTSREKINQILKEIDPVNTQLTQLENSFSYTLGEGSRWLENLILKILFLIAITVEFTGLFLTISVSITISKGINEVVRVAQRIADSDFSEKAKVFSKDEIGQLADSFNKMVGDLNEKIKERREAEYKLKEQKELYETLVNTQSEMGEGVAITENQKIVFANPALCNMYGYSEKEILSMSSFIDLIIPEDKERLTKRLQERLIMKEVSDTGETSIVKKNGQIINVEYSIKMSHVVNKTQFISIIRDITEKKKINQRLQNYSEKLERSNKDLEQFAYVVSHDLREPLRTVNGYIELLQQRYQNNLDAEANEFINHAVDGVTRMNRLISDILAFSRISTQNQDLEWIDCSKVMETVMAISYENIQQSKAQITFDILPIIEANELQITQLFQNLISNAIKFRGEKSPVIHVSVKENKKEWLFSVSDNGIGIDKKYADKIFVIFQRLHSKSAYEGTGIGLAICKKIVEQLGGKIWFESEIGKGTVFHFTIKKENKFS